MVGVSFGVAVVGCSCWRGWILGIGNRWFGVGSWSRCIGVVGCTRSGLGDAGGVGLRCSCRVGRRLGRWMWFWGVMLVGMSMVCFLLDLELVVRRCCPSNWFLVGLFGRDRTGFEVAIHNKQLNMYLFILLIGKVTW